MVHKTKLNYLPGLSLLAHHPKALPLAEPHGTTVEVQVNGGAKVPWHSPQAPSLRWGWEWHIPGLVPLLCFSKDLKMGSHTPNSLG